MALVGAAMLALTSVASNAGTTGSIELNLGGQLYSANDYTIPGCCSFPLLTRENAFTFGGAGRVNVQNRDWGYQLDVQGDASLNGKTTNTYGGSFAGGAHVFMRDPSKGLIGIFGGVGDGSNNGQPAAEVFMVGAEAQYFFDNATFYAQAGYNDGVSGGYGCCGGVAALDSAFFLRGVGRYFFSPDQMLQAEITYDDGRGGASINADMTTFAWGARYEQACSFLGANVFAAYRGDYMKSSINQVPVHVAENILLLGLRFQFGGSGTLLDNDRNGTSLDLPDVARWSSYAAGTL